MSETETPTEVQGHFQQPDPAENVSTEFNNSNPKIDQKVEQKIEEKVEEPVEPPAKVESVELKVEPEVQGEVEPAVEAPVMTKTEVIEAPDVSEAETIVKTHDTLDVNENDEIVKSASPPSPVPVPTGGFQGAMSRWETTVTQSSEESTPVPKSPVPEVGSIQDRMTFYKKNTGEKENQLQKTESVPASVGSLADRKNMYLSNSRTTSTTPTSTTSKGASNGLKERMKAYENNKSSNLVRRETVSSGERASDIKSRIMGWGNQKQHQKSENAAVPKPGKINSRLNQYQKNAGQEETEQEI